MPSVNGSPATISTAQLDMGFSGDGRIGVALGSGNDQARSIAIQADGRYVVAGWADSGSGNNDFAVMRFMPDGSLDTSFSADGKQSTNISGSDQAYGVAIQADGKIVVVGVVNAGSTSDIAIVRYNANGSLDTGFDSDGQVVTSLAGADTASGVLIQPDQKILVVGASDTDSQYGKMALLRYNADGSLDATFGSGGKGFADFNYFDDGQALALQTDGKIIVAGYVWTGSENDLTVARFNANGSLDTSFSGDGLLAIDISAINALSADRAFDVIVQSNGKILLAGSTAGSIGTDALLVRLNADGAVDTSFGGGDGIVTLDKSNTDVFNSIVLQADGKILAAGSAATGFGEALVARFNVDGSLDTTFGGNGTFSTVFTSGTSAIYDVALAPNGQLVAVGDSYTGTYDFGVLRLASGLSDQVATSGSALTYTVPAGAFVATNNTPMTYTAALAGGAALPSWLTFNPQTQTFSGTPDAADFGTFLVKVTASDGVGTVDASFQLDVSSNMIQSLMFEPVTYWNADVIRGSGADLSYSFMTAAPSYASASETSTFQALNAAQQSAVVQVLGLYAGIANLNFTSVADSGNGGQLRFGRNDQGGASAGYANYPGTSPVAGDVWIDKTDAFNTTPVVGDYGYEVLVHEIGHALGLKHPFEGTTTLPTLEDTRLNTVMSYTDAPNRNFRTVTQTGNGYSWSYTTINPETPMVYDIAAIQYLYGANTSFHAGNDTYTFDPTSPFFKTIWDGGGSDTISIANFSTASIIDLRDGHYSSIRIPSNPLPPGTSSNVTDIYDGTNNLGIAFNVIIENAVGGSGNDQLIGNDVANLLDGGGGNDILDGGAGRDVLTGGLGNDTYMVDNTGDSIVEVSNPVGEVDTVNAALSWRLGANLENLVLLASKKLSATGNSQNNTLTGNDGNNVLNGGVGADTMIGGAGNDTYIVDNVGDVIQESDSSPSQVETIRASLSWTLGTNLENLILTGSKGISGTGNSLDNSLAGNAGNNTLSGGDGNDTLSGLAGNDILTGGNGSDIFNFANALNPSTNVDTITDFTSGSDKVQLAQAIFSQIGFTGTPVSNAFFYQGSAAHDADDRILYNQTTGALSYDSDGSGASAAVTFAILGSSTHPAILHSDFIVI